MKISIRALLALLSITIVIVGCAGPSAERAGLEAQLESAQNALATAQALAESGSKEAEQELANVKATADAAAAALADLEAKEGLEPVLVGVSLPLSGPVAISGFNQINGFKLGIQEINEAGGVLGGRPIRLIVEDNKCVPAEGISTYEKLHNVDKVSVTYGASCSGVTLAVMPLIQEAEIPNVTAVSTNPKITELSGIGGNIWEFRINAPDSAFGAVAGRVYVETLGYKTFSALVSDDEWGRGAFAEFKKSIEASGGQIISEDYFAMGETDFLTVLTKIKSLQPDSILAFMNPDPALIVGKQYVELGMDIPFSGRSQYFTEQMQKEVGCENIVGWASIDPWFNVDPSPRAEEFVTKIRQNFGIDAVWQHLTPYTAAYVIAQAIDRAGSDVPAAIRDALEQTDYDSIYGRLQFDDHNQAHGNVYSAQMQPGCKLEVIFAGSF